MLLHSISELLEGEGPNAGLPMLLVRVAGCNLRCTFCDQPDALNGGKEYTTREVRKEIEDSKLSWLMFSGGEPLLYPHEIGDLTRTDKHVEINTNGCMPVPEWFSRVDTWIVDCKCPSSGMRSTKIEEWREMLRCQDYIKYVVGTEEDLEFVLKTAGSGVDIVSPVMSDVRLEGGKVVVSEKQAAWNQRVAEFCLEYGFRLSIQNHVLLWGQGRQDK